MDVLHLFLSSLVSLAVGGLIAVLFVKNQQHQGEQGQPMRQRGRRRSQKGSEEDLSDEAFDQSLVDSGGRRGSLGIELRASDPSPLALGNRRGSTFQMPEDAYLQATGASEGLWQGFSMEDARLHSEMEKASANARTPAQVLSELQKGNARFWMGKATQKHASAFQRRALIMQQYPKCAILGCSDSRVPIEIVFDQGLGDLFVIRVAGNCLDTTTRASLEYAINHLKVKVLVVMGHEGCGAVKAAVTMGADQIAAETDNLASMLTNLKKGLDEERLTNIFDSRARDREAVVTNVRRQVETLTNDEEIMDKVRKQDLIVLGAFYEISSGIVDFFHEVSEVDSEDVHESPKLEPTHAHPGVQSVFEVPTPRSRALRKHASVDGGVFRTTL